MSIKKRLFISNILMIIIPVCIALMVSAFSLAIVSFSMRNDSGFGVGNGSMYYRYCTTIVQSVKQQIEIGKQDFSDAKSMCDTYQMHLLVRKQSETFFDYGDADAADEDLLEATSYLDGDISVAADMDRSVYKVSFAIENVDYTVFVFGSHTDVNNKGIKEVLWIVGMITFVTVMLSIILINKYLVKGAIKRIEDPIELLLKGVEEIEEGNLSYRISYPYEDEFAKICEAFNHMAVQLENYNKQITENEISRKELLAGISHDIRSPLTSIKAYVDGLCEGVADDEEKREQYLRVIKRKTDDIDRLVSQLFMFSKLELKDFPISLVKTDISELVTQYVMDYGKEYEDKGLNLHLNEAEKCKAFIDIEQFIRILDNVVGNSMKYKSKEQGNLYITVRKVLGRVKILIEDDGAGVPKESMDKLFDVFYRMDKARSNPSAGSGLGLAIVARLIDKMEGSVKAFESEYGGLGIEIVLKSEV